MTAFVLMGVITSHIWFIEIKWPVVAYFGTYENCNAALNSQAAVHGNNFTAVCYPTGIKQ